MTRGMGGGVNTGEQGGRDVEKTILKTNLWQPMKSAATEPA